MRRFQILMLAVSLTLIAPVGHALADGPGAGYSGVKIAQVSFIDRALNLIQLSDGMELKAPDRADARRSQGRRVGEGRFLLGRRAQCSQQRPARPARRGFRALPAMSGDVANRG